MSQSPGNVSVQQFFLKAPEYYMIDQERTLHEEAVYAYGEYSFFALKWNVDDFEADLVGHCPYCYLRGGIEEEIASVYKQPAIANCPYCYGTTFWDPNATKLNGLKALIVRATLWNNTDEAHKQVPQGDVTTSVTQFQTISDFRMRSGDWVIKADGTRWRVQQRESTNVISGFQASDDVRTMIGYLYTQVIREDESSVVFLIPPDIPTSKAILDVSPAPNYPIDMSQYEVINGPLLAGDLATDSEGT